MQSPDNTLFICMLSSITKKKYQKLYGDIIQTYLRKLVVTVVYSLNIVWIRLRGIAFS